MQQYIIYTLWTGHSYSYIAETLSVSSSSIHNKDSKSRRLLREYACERFKAQYKVQAPTALPSCAIVLPSKMDEEDERQFRQVVEFLTLQMGVSKFLVEHFNCHSQFVNCLLRMKNIRQFRVELVTHYSDSIATTWGSTSEGFVPPFDGVVNIDSSVKQLKPRYLRALSDLLNRSDYAIYKGTADSDPATFRQIQRHKQLKVFNLGRSVEHVTL